MLVNGKVEACAFEQKAFLRLSHTWRCLGTPEEQLEGAEEVG